jgi:hypothetical protein
MVINQWYGMELKLSGDMKIVRGPRDIIRDQLRSGYRRDFRCSRGLTIGRITPPWARQVFIVYYIDMQLVLVYLSVNIH